MRKPMVPWRVGVAVAVLLQLGGCLPPGGACCDDDVECAEGTRCFEGRCAPRCDGEAEQADAQCDEGERCVPEAGVCRAADPEVELKECGYQDERQ